MKHTSSGTFFGLALRVQVHALWGTFALFTLFAGLGMWVFGFAPIRAISGGFLFCVLHWVAVLMHQLGHALAAKLTGFRMKGIRFGTRFFFATSVYPSDEPDLSSRVHIRRALGGPISSAAFTVLVGAVALSLRDQGGVAWFVGTTATLENALVFALGSLLPLGFTDGSTILRYWN